MGAININSPSKHIDELKMFICDNPMDVLAVIETKLDCSIPDTVVYLPEYTLHTQRSHEMRWWRLYVYLKYDHF